MEEISAWLTQHREWIALIFFAAWLAWSWWSTGQQRRYPSSGLIKELFETGPVEPKYSSAKSIESGGSGTTWGISDADRQFFRDFDRFAELINSQNQDGPWQLQEAEKTELLRSSLDADGPVFGRGYKVFYNQMLLGDVEICAGYKYESASNPSVTMRVELSDVRLLPFDEIRFFLLFLMKLLSGDKQAEAREECMWALIRAHWDTNPWGITAWRSRDKKFDRDAVNGIGRLTLRWTGSATIYLQWRKPSSASRKRGRKKSNDDDKNQ